MTVWDTSIEAAEFFDLPDVSMIQRTVAASCQWKRNDAHVWNE